MIFNTVNYTFLDEQMQEANNQATGVDNQTAAMIDSGINGTDHSAEAKSSLTSQLGNTDEGYTGIVDFKGIATKEKNQSSSNIKAIQEQRNTIQKQNSQNNMNSAVGAVADNVGNFSNWKKKEKGEKGKAVAGAIGAAANVAANVMDNSGSAEDVANKEKYMGTDNKVSGVANNFGVVGKMVGGLTKMGYAIGKKDVKGTDNYGIGNDEHNAQAYGRRGFFDPASSAVDAVKLTKSGDMDSKEFWKHGFSEVGRAKMRIAEDRRETGAQRKEDMDSQRERLANIQNSQEDYQDLMRYSNMYSGSYIAKNGGIIRFLGGSYIARQLGMYSEEKEETNKTKIFKKGGNLKVTKKGFKKPIFKGVSIIMDGPLHSEFNKIGDKGLPIVLHDGGKIFEIEREELLIDEDSSDVLSEKQHGKPEDLGKAFADILFRNTKSKTNKFQCLNNNTCNI